MGPTNFYTSSRNLVDQANRDARRRSSKRLGIIVVSTILLACLIAAITVIIVRGNRRSVGNIDESESPSISASIKTMCDNSVYPESCYDTLSDATNSTTNPMDLYRIAIGIAMNEVLRANDELEVMKNTVDPKYHDAIVVCEELLNMSYDSLNASISSDLTSSTVIIDDLKTWMSASLTYQDTCLESFSDDSMRTQISGVLANSTEFASNGLSILTQFATFLGVSKMRRRSMLEYIEKESTLSQFPTWLSSKDRKLLEEPNLRGSAKITVAKDGSGTHTSINAALKDVPLKSTARTVIYVKEGIYNEYVEIEKKMKNIMMIGDGKSLTVITGSKNFVDGTPTFKSATLIASGEGFIAIDLSIVNTAGYKKHQAVAMRSNADKSVFYRCKFDAYQDTLYTHSMRQFYRDCDVLGTVDFIFGNAAVVFQNCRLMPRLPGPGQKVLITAQGKTDKNQNTGTSIQNCYVVAYGQIGDTPVYLGRPWKAYATTVFMKTALPSFLHKEGWLAWEGSSGPKTIFYGEYQNTGTGSSVWGRVKWEGVHSSLSTSQASAYTVNSLLAGGLWIKPAGAPYSTGL
ncbi:pectin methylesterase, family CE8 [Zostera marina]|uniref:Pectinesterase n=1 Tax=Zostera marina TaxID=29655 RepID=A0A0K9PYY0_ZOSMR|nr:pectin methylesterase, family CE8 [Zostera marina]